MKKLKKAIIVMVPYPAQGHVSPMQKLARAFVGYGFETVMVIPEFIDRQIGVHECEYKYKNKYKYKYKYKEDDDQIKWVALPDGLENQEEEGRRPDFFDIETAMENCMPTHLEGLLHNLHGDDADVACLIVDLLASWAIQVAHSCSIPCAGFWPAMFASYLLISSIPHMLSSRLISNTGLPQNEGKICLEPELPVISTEDLPWLVGTDAARKARFKFWKRTLERSSALKWLLVNSFFDERTILEQQKTELPNNKFSSQGCPRVFPIGPICICRNQLRKSVSVSVNVSFWEEDLSCLNWLEKQKANSVVYISFGSWVSSIGEVKLKNLALALEASEMPFIWVLRSSWRKGLPVGFLERLVKQGRGILVSWAPQNQILQHDSVACYITHCGWNSILEALQFRKKLLCYPLAGDQFVNSLYVVQLWRVGLKLNGLEPNHVQEGLLSLIQDKEMDARLNKFNQTIMGSTGNNDTGAFMLKTFVQDLNNYSKSSFSLLFHC